MWESCRRGRLTLIVGVTVAPPALSSGLVGEQGNRRATLSRAPVTVPASTMAPARLLVSLRQAAPILSSAWRWRQPVRNGCDPGQRVGVDTVLHGLRDEESPTTCLLAPSRRRQRLPVQLWGQLQRPCRVLGAATDSWSLQLRCSAVMTRCGRARLAAGATEINSTPRLVGIRPLCRWSQYRLGAASL
jgi:hypothetical protein